MRRFGFITLTILFVTVMLLAGCSTEADKGSADKTLQLNLTGEPASLDPADAFDTDTLDVTHNLFEGLMRLDEKHKPQPAVAESVDVSSDGLTYTFKLKKTNWSNGEPVTAHDFEYAWKRALNPKRAYQTAFLFYFIEGAEEYNTGRGAEDQVAVKATDDTTLQVKLKQPTPSFLELVSYPSYAPVNKKVDEQNEKWHAEAKTYVSNGAFKLTEWKHDAELKAEKNEHYHQKDKVKLSGLHFAIINDNKTVYTMFKTKKLDVVGKSQVPADLVPSLIESGKLKPSEGNGLAFFRFNVSKEPFTNQKVRKAFALSIDRKTIAEQIIAGGEQPAYGYVHPSAPNEFRKQGGDLIQDNQAAEAKNLLEEGMKEAGWSKLPEVTLLYSNSNEKYKKVAEAVQEMVRKNLGVDIRLQAKERKVFFADERAKNYTMSLSSFLADYNDAYNYLESFQTDHSMNRTNWSDAKYDELLMKAAQTADVKERDKALHEAEKILIDEAPLTPLYFYTNAVVDQPGVTGIIRHPVGPSDYSQADKTKQ
ncbi:peptide ABC transporter substrate-binding protein [Laceyella putida]|uniref:Peptide ABC transporter substrate-binding protein n=1 Tax=Laceyella putida TaxID=110101 RepID=A0ABW2RHT3_9BACL